MELMAKTKGDYISMRTILTVSALLLLIAGNALAVSEYDRCINEEKTLRRREAGECSGFSYLVNPSACFKTRRILNEYTSSGKCHEIGVTENVDFGVQPPLPPKNAGSGGKTAASGRGITKRTELEAPQQESGCEQLSLENTRLKTENSRLKTENELLRKTGR